MHPDHLGLAAYLLVVGSVLALAGFELVSILRTQRHDRRMRKGSSDRTHGD
jgi:hypothetical protein